MAYDIGQTCMLVNIGLSRSECASWVQAWGSIGAIVMAAWAVHWAHRKQLRQKEREAAADYTRFLETLFQLLGGTRGVAFKITEVEAVGSGSTPDEQRTMLAELSALSDAFKRVDLSRFDRYDYVEAWLVGDGLTRKLISAIEYFASPAYSLTLDPRYLEFTAGEAIRQLDARGSKLYAAIEARGGPPGSPALPKDWTKRASPSH
ncbi:hypothetical protein [Variovorax atrisoli]|uniref:hypothetical protein n=1 Tax=Variovorax atrisoli TaxID=3394203 RepID=UPI0003678137|nr:hypothetical protein [Variovorax paradoxus]